MKHEAIKKGLSLLLTLVMILSISGAALAATPDQNGDGSRPPMPDRSNSEIINAIASVTGQTVEEIQQQLTAGKTLADLVEGVNETTLAEAIEQASIDSFQGTPTEEQLQMIQERSLRLAQMLISGEQPGTPSGRPNGRDEIIEAVAAATGQTVEEIKEQLNSEKTLTELAQNIDETALAEAIEQVALSKLEGTPTQDQLDKIADRAVKMAKMLLNGQFPEGSGNPDQRPEGPGMNKSNGISLKIGSTKMTVNGLEKEIDPGYQTVPTIIDGSTYVPIRSVIESLGGTVEWNGAEQQITITLNNVPVVLQIGNNQATVNGTVKELNGAPFISDTGRTMLPLRFITENLGHSVSWDGATQTITIQ